MERDYFQAFAHYNAWANGRLYAAAAGLPAATLAQRRPAAFFRSIIGTLNHILVADRLWLARLEDLPPPHKTLDEEPHPRLEDLWAARQDEDARLLRYLEALAPAAPLEEVVYRTTKGVAMRQPLWQVLAHLFNHQTHHRGQAHALLTEAGLAPPPLDLLYYLRPAR